MIWLALLAWVAAGVVVALLVGVLRHGPRCRCQRLGLLLALAPLTQAEVCAVAVPRHAEYGTWGDAARIEIMPGGFCQSDPWGTTGRDGPWLWWYGVPQFLHGEPTGSATAPMWFSSDYGNAYGHLIARWQPPTTNVPAYHTLGFDTGEVTGCQGGVCYFWRLQQNATGFGYTFISGWRTTATQCVNARPALLQCPGTAWRRASYYAPFDCYQPLTTRDASICRRFLFLSSGRDGDTGCCAQVRAGENPAEQCGVYPFGDPY